MTDKTTEIHTEFLKTQSNPEIKLRYVFLRHQTSNKTIVLFPGYLGSIEERFPLIKEFNKHFNVIIYEPRGYGGSSKPHKKGIYGINDYAYELKQVLEHFKLQDNKFAIFGSSLGTVPMQYYGAYLSEPKPEPAAMLMVSASSHFPGANFFNYIGWLPDWLIVCVQKLIVFPFLLLTRGKESRKDTKYAIKRMNELDGWVQRRIAIECIAKTNLKGKEQDNKYPLFLIASSDDAYSPPEVVKQYVRANPLNESKFINTGEHKLIEGREPELVEYMCEFLQQKIWPDDN